MKTDKQIEELKEKKCAIKKTDLFTLRPNLGHDTLNGQKTNRGVIHMGYDLCTAKFKHEGKSVEIRVIGGGGVALSVSGGRSCNVNLERLIELAIEQGLLDEKIDFMETE